MTEIIAMNAGMHNEDGVRIRHRGDYAVSVVNHIGKYFNDLQAEKPPKKDRTMLSIPEILRSDKDMYDNTVRLWFMRAKPSDTPSEDEVVWRFKCDPVKISRGKKFRLYGLHIQPNPLRVELAGVAVTVDEEVPGGDGATADGKEGEQGDETEDGEDEDDEGIFVT